MVQIIEPTYEILSYEETALTNIERAARTCYKSEDKIIDDYSAKKLVYSLIKRGHMAMIEFGGDLVVKFVSNRGFSHEVVRHRLASFGQESTRYCNYSKSKFGAEITCVNPYSVVMRKLGHDQNHAMKIAETMILAWRDAEDHYMDLIRMGVPPDIAREVLPIGVKAEIVVKANVREWRHIFTQRCSKKAHPRMRELMIPLLKEVNELIPVVFEDILSNHLLSEVCLPKAERF